jgi:hypothetical protein
MAAQEDSSGLLSPIIAAADRSESTTLLVAKVQVSFKISGELMNSGCSTANWNDHDNLANLKRRITGRAGASRRVGLGPLAMTSESGPQVESQLGD